MCAITITNSLLIASSIISGYDMILLFDKMMQKQQHIFRYFVWKKIGLLSTVIATHKHRVGVKFFPIGHHIFEKNNKDV